MANLRKFVKSLFKNEKDQYELWLDSCADVIADPGYGESVITLLATACEKTQIQIDQIITLAILQNKSSAKIYTGPHKAIVEKHAFLVGLGIPCILKPVE